MKSNNKEKTIASTRRPPRNAYPITLLLRTAAMAVFAYTVYCAVSYFLVFFSGETGTELLIFALPIVLVLFVAGIGVAVVLFMLTIWQGVGLRQSITTRRKANIAIVIPIGLGLVCAALYNSYQAKSGTLNEHDVTIADQMYDVVIEISDLPQPPRTLAEANPVNNHSGYGITYSPGDDFYTLCATFEQNTIGMYYDDDGAQRPGGVNFYKHPKGRACFKVDPVL